MYPCRGRPERNQEFLGNILYRQDNARIERSRVRSSCRDSLSKTFGGSLVETARIELACNIEAVQKDIILIFRSVKYSDRDQRPARRELELNTKWPEIRKSKI